MRSFHFIIFLLILSFCGYSQPHERDDSLYYKIYHSKTDSAKAYAFNEIASFHLRSDPDSANIYLKKARGLASNNNLKKILSYNFTLTGNLNYFVGKTDTAYKYYLQALEINEGIKDTSALSANHVHLSRIYSKNGQIDKALDELVAALDIARKGNKQKEEADCLFALAVLYDRQDVPEKAIVFCKDAAEIQKKINDPAGLANSYHRMGLAYYSLKNYKAALEKLQLSLDLRSKLKNKEKIGASLNGIGLVYLETKEYQKALKYFYDAYKNWYDSHDNEGIVIASANLGQISSIMGDEENAFRYYLESYKMADSIKAISFQKNSAKSLAELYYKKKDYKSAYDYFRKYSDLRDTIFSEENSERVAQMQSKYESEQKENKIKLLTQQTELDESEISRKKILLNSISGAVVLLLVVLFMFMMNIKQKQKANQKLQDAYSVIENKNVRLIEVYNELEQNRDEVAHKNKEITDSIKYAKRLQEAILPSNEFIKKLFPESFVLYKPKDIVSGDFYWFEHLGNKKLFAAVDCTGHGVPGAFMSIVGYNQLNQAVNENGLDKPNLILNALNKGVTKTLRQSREGSSIKDGMDIALCAYDESTGIFEYAGAYNSLWMIRNNRLTEIKADKKPIGVFVGEEMQPFNNYEIKVQMGDMIYVYTDGYADQFGGEKGKKFKYKSLQRLLIENNHLSMEEQLKMLDDTIEEWRGALEQVDDILLIGIKI
jgi:serine phosphatase RsbU (regulator of sigma subunit)